MVRIKAIALAGVTSSLGLSDVDSRALRQRSTCTDGNGQHLVSFIETLLAGSQGGVDGRISKAVLVAFPSFEWLVPEYGVFQNSKTESGSNRR